MLKFSGFADLTSRVVGRINSLSKASSKSSTESPHRHELTAGRQPRKRYTQSVKAADAAITPTTETMRQDTLPSKIDTETDRLSSEPESTVNVQESLVRGIMRFTVFITLRCALHRCSSRGIHRWQHRIWRHALMPNLQQWLPGANASWRTLVRQHLRNDPFAGSPTKTLLRLLLPLSNKIHRISRFNIRRPNTDAVHTIHLSTQSVGATGGVYKGQGHNQYELMTRTY